MGESTAKTCPVCAGPLHPRAPADAIFGMGTAAKLLLPCLRAISARQDGIANQLGDVKACLEGLDDKISDAGIAPLRDLALRVDALEHLVRTGTERLP